MKRIALVLLALLVATTAAHSTELGFTGGLNLANQSGDWVGNKTLLGFGAGVFGRFTPSPGFIIQPEALYMMKGTKFEFLDEEIKFKCNYIEFAIPFGYAFPLEGAVSPVFFVGPAMGILMSAKLTYEGESENVKEFLKSTDIGLLFGAGVDIKTGEKGKFMLGGRYTLGLTNINDDPADPDFKMKNGVFSIFAGFAFLVGE